MSQIRQFIYRVDAQDRVTHVDAHWPAFAVDDGLPSLTAKMAAGTSLWDHFSETGTREFYRQFMAKVRNTGLPIVVPFRGDAPDCRRFMELGIILLAEQALEFRCFLLREEPRPQVELFNPRLPHKAELLPVCSWCKKVQGSGWREAEDALRELKLAESPAMPMLSHTICPDCRKTLERIVAAG